MNLPEIILRYFFFGIGGTFKLRGENMESYVGDFRFERYNWYNSINIIGEIRENESSNDVFVLIRVQRD